MTTTEPTLVSVIVPVFDGDRFLAEALDSLLTQDHPDVEIVAIDDGSTDSSAAILAAHPTVRVVTQTNRGVASARNAGLEVARGSFLAFCDQDDIFYPSKISAQLAYLDAHPSTAFVLCRQDLILEGGMQLPSWMVPDPVYGDPGGVLPLSGLARRSTVDTVGPFDPDLEPSDDFDWLLRVRAAGLEVDVLDQKLMAHRLHDRNESNNRERILRGTALSVHRRILAHRARRDEDA